MHYTWGNRCVMKINFGGKVKRSYQKVVNETFVMNRNPNLNWNLIELPWPLANVGK